VISIFMTRAAENNAPIIHGDGLQYRDFIYVKDVVRANLLAATVDNADGEVFNIGTGRFVRVSQLWETIARLAGVDLPPVLEKRRAGDILESVADIQKAGLLLGFEPVYGFEEGLKKTFEWYRRGDGNDISV
jgi:nucleoside-diphosphate-sugar epimerase